MPSSSKSEAVVYTPQELSSIKTTPEKETVFKKNDFLANNAHFEIDPQVATHMGLFEARSKEEKRVFDAEVLKYVQSIKDDAYEQAHKLGKEEGVVLAKKEALENAEAEIKEQLSHLSKVLNALDKYRKRMYEENESEIISFSYYIAEKIILGEVKTNKEVIANLIKKMIPEEQSCVVYLNVKDIDFIQGNKHLLDKDLDLNLIKFEVDENLKEGDVILETPNGTLDGTLETRLKKIKSAIEQLG